MTVFNKEHDNSGDGMLTAVWGPPMWHTLHTISFNYPIKPTKDQKEHYYQYFKTLEHILPCRYCRENYKENLKKLKFGKKYFKDRDALSRFVYTLHEMVNKNLGKSSGLTFNQVRDRYEHFRSRCTIEKPNIFKYTKKNIGKKEKGCTTPLYGKKSKCVINIVPQEKKCKTFKIDKKCLKKKNK